MVSENKLYRCPYDAACKCDMTEPCLGCEDFKPEKLSSGDNAKYGAPMQTSVSKCGVHDVNCTHWVIGNMCGILPPAECHNKQ